MKKWKREKERGLDLPIYGCGDTYLVRWSMGIERARTNIYPRTAIPSVGRKKKLLVSKNHNILELRRWYTVFPSTVFLFAITPRPQIPTLGFSVFGALMLAFVTKSFGKRNFCVVRGGILISRLPCTRGKKKGAHRPCVWWKMCRGSAEKAGFFCWICSKTNSVWRDDDG